ncbi:uncharacterized protein TA12015 [Theileria annulata]|uniref:AP2/ERF domain-containing protein n=1 Tax=Theileria annulata TaxID=5874 RepID=Q4UDT1_THEAN|nr:uncharacterized protein TA12015 [Theileria annulata]CAI74758.1 hypothetical protein TA12015 [Theileria annulata]|eukprot:XP_952490.1 hypothetical protein TA12015 [Theileria annulata]
MVLNSTNTQETSPDSSIKTETNSESEPPTVKAKRGKSTSKNYRRKGKKIVPKEANLIKNIPEEHYFSDVSGVYYHFKKMEWRTICKDPFNNSKRTQKTFGINKYGFYEAKHRAEMTAFEITERNHISKVLSSCGRILVPENHSSQTPYNVSAPYFNPQLDSVNKNFLKIPFDNSVYSAKMPPNLNNYSCHNGNIMVYNLNGINSLSILPQTMPFGAIPAIKNQFYHSVHNPIPYPLVSMDNNKASMLWLNDWPVRLLKKNHPSYNLADYCPNSKKRWESISEQI